MIAYCPPCGIQSEDVSRECAASLSKVHEAAAGHPAQMGERDA